MVSLTFLRSSLGNFIGNIDGASFRLNALVIENVFTSRFLFQKLVVEHYKNQAVGQLLSIVGAADALGNPSGLFRNIGTGVKDFFVEPTKGLFLGPDEFLDGVAKGTSSLVSKAFYGFFDSTSKISGTVGRGLTRATLDSNFKEGRNQDPAPENLEEGIYRGVAGLSKGLSEGFLGILKQPMLGAERGIGGFVQGIGKGLVGAITKPAVGILDLTHNVTAGVKTSFREKDPPRVRYPRFIPPPGRVTSYDPATALGAHVFEIIRTGLGFPLLERYVGHVVLDPDSSSRKTCLVTTGRLLLIRLEQFESGEALLPVDLVSHDISLWAIQAQSVRSKGVRLQTRTEAEPFVIVCASPDIALQLNALIQMVLEQILADSEGGV